MTCLHMLVGSCSQHYVTINITSNNSICTGAEDHLKTVDHNIWIRAVREKSQSPPPFYPLSFETLAKAALWDEFHMQREDIDATNLKDIYVYLINKLSH